MAEPASADDLYGVDPAEFVTARAALAKRLRADGDREEAARVAKLRRPPQSAWALNLLARTDPDRIDAVFAAATALRDALADGGAGTDRREAQAAYRGAIDAAVAAAAALAEVTADDMRNRIRTNLLAAGVDEDLASPCSAACSPTTRRLPASAARRRSARSLPGRIVRPPRGHQAGGPTEAGEGHACRGAGGGRPPRRGPGRSRGCGSRRGEGRGRRRRPGP